ncbi:hypothetical protein AXF42_Ash013086 [Apostasia shenzhenica]|uniref:Uncharacterized protein n=1 Tax=Apostasia shenzhenica TaxID=1088818 RepID=A0A2I0BD05_9ASPA|nr:hypothetical protein AXF42_Ash013086 [Apostasia shenzhenica]
MSDCREVIQSCRTQGCNDVNDADERGARKREEIPKNGRSTGTRRKIQGKAEQVILSPFRRFGNHLDDSKKKMKNMMARRSPPRFIYDGEEFRGRPSCHLCFLQPSIPPPAALPAHLKPGSAAVGPDAARKGKSKPSSYYHFVKSLIEKNDFYSSECNVHRDISDGHPT